MLISATHYYFVFIIQRFENRSYALDRGCQSRSKEAAILYRLVIFLEVISYFRIFLRVWLLVAYASALEIRQLVDCNLDLF